MTLETSSSKTCLFWKRQTKMFCQNYVRKRCKRRASPMRAQALLRLRLRLRLWKPALFSQFHSSEPCLLTKGTTDPLRRLCSVGLIRLLVVHLNRHHHCWCHLPQVNITSAERRQVALHRCHNRLATLCSLATSLTSRDCQSLSKLPLLPLHQSRLRKPVQSSWKDRPFTGERIVYLPLARDRIL